MRIPALLFLFCLVLAGCQPERGCTNPAAHNFNPAAAVDDGSCSTEPIMDGHIYPVVQIGEQTWFAENLRTTAYANGDPIRSGLTAQEWTVATEGATAVYGESGNVCDHDSPTIDACDEAQSLATYGRLYNWLAVDDDRGLCPNGWHVPTHDDWSDLEFHIATQGNVGPTGAALKSKSGWYQGGNGTDDFGFTSLPTGRRRSCCGDFRKAGASSLYWSSTPYDEYAWFRGIEHNSGGFGRGIHHRKDGMAVRCVKDVD